MVEVLYLEKWNGKEGVESVHNDSQEHKRTGLSFETLPPFLRILRLERPQLTQSLTYRQILSQFVCAKPPSNRLILQDRR